MISGMLMRNATRQPTLSTSVPPTNGARSVAADVPAAQMPNALERAGPSNNAVMIAIEPGTSSAPDTPWRIRNTTSSSRVGARPQRTDVTPNPTSPIAKTRRRP